MLIEPSTASPLMPAKITPMTKDAASELAIKEEADIVHVRRIAREVSQRAGFSSTDVTRIVTACSEMARNIFKYAGNGNMRWRCVELSGRQGLELVFQDTGPGIADVNLAMQEGYTTS